METTLGFTGAAWALFGAAIAALGGAAGSAIGITYVARVGAGVLSEDPEKFGPVLILAAMPGTQGFYGFVAAFLVLIFFNLFTDPTIPPAVGTDVFFACIPVAGGCLVSAIFQGMTCAAGATMVGRRVEAVGRAIILSALVETYAVISLVITISLLLVARAAMG